MKRTLLLFGLLFAVFFTASAQVLLQENFNYTAGTALTANGWTITGTSVTNVINVANSGLSYTGYVGSNVGNAASMTNTGQDVYNTFASKNSGTVYASLLVNISAAQIGDYFFHFTQGLITSNAFYGRVFVRLADNGKLAFAITKSSVAAPILPVYTDSVYLPNTTYMLVVKYKFIAATTTDDEVSLFVLTDPALLGSEPTPTAGPITTSQTDATDLGIINLRQGSATNAPTVVVDGIRVGTSWSDAVKSMFFDNPSKLMVKNAEAPVVLDGKLDESDWNGAPALLFGNGAFAKKQPGDMTVSNGFDLKAGFKVNGVDYSIPNKDSSWARVKFIRKGMDLFVGVQSNDKSICRFDWEGEGLFLQIKDNANVTKEYKLYYQNIAGNKDTIRYEESVLNSGAGMGFLPVGSTANDTTNVDNGYSVELRIRLDKLGYTAGVNAVQMSMNIFDPDGFQFNAALPWPYGMSPWDSARGSYYKSWWGSEWGDVMKTLEFQTEFDNPDTLLAKNSSSVITLDGKLTEADWSTANTLVFGPANAPKTGTEKTVTGGYDIKKNFDVNGVQYKLPYSDTSYTRVKFLAKGNDLFVGIQSPDKSICKFDWEGDGLFIKIKNSAGDDKEFKLYWQNIAGNKDTIRYEEQVLNSGAGAGSLVAGSSVNDTTNVDNGYTAELRIKLNTLGFAPTTAALNLRVAMTIFDPDGYQHPMAPWDSARGTYYKSWWGSEWGGVYKTIAFPKTTGVQELGEIPLTFALNQNYPNPFNPSTVIRYSIPAASNVSLKIYNLLGQEVATLVNMTQKPGNYETSFNGTSLSSGVYIYRIQAGTFVETKKMMLLK